MPLPANKQRSRRQRKKMHIGEFQELGFEYEVTPAAELAPRSRKCSWRSSSKRSFFRAA